MTKRFRIYSRLVPSLSVKPLPSFYGHISFPRFVPTYRRCWVVKGDNGSCMHGTHAAAIDCASRRAFAAAMEEATC